MNAHRWPPNDRQSSRVEHDCVIQIAVNNEALAPFGQGMHGFIAHGDAAKCENGELAGVVVAVKAAHEGTSPACQARQDGYSESR